MENSIAKIEPQNEVAGVLGVIERAALNPAIDVAKMSALLDMQERILNRQSQQAFATAFAEMQPELPEVIEKSKAHNSNYASLEDINDAVKPILAKHGFGLSFRVNQDNGTIKVTGILSHRDGHSESTDLAGSADTSGSKNAIQGIGSSVSYLKRYVLCALLNISTRGQDDDGAGGVIALEDAAEIDQKITEVGADKARFLKFMGVTDVREILAKDYGKALNALKAKAGKK